MMDGVPAMEAIFLKRRKKPFKSFEKMKVRLVADADQQDTLRQPRPPVLYSLCWWLQRMRNRTLQLYQNADMTLEVPVYLRLERTMFDFVSNNPKYNTYVDARGGGIVVLLKNALCMGAWKDYGNGSRIRVYPCLLRDLGFFTL